MEGLFIEKENLVKLETWVSDIPTKYGMELIVFLNQCKAKQAQNEAKEEPISSSE